ncbi:MAG: aminoacyl-tRNA hydrolase [Alphaproteobacteria bacterium]|nr:aminoacyl-tRNA hydrolase [Alphaproteobacteria bacterium]
MFLVVGLGNKGPEYENTRHNIGFMAADKIICRYPFDKGREKFQALLYSGTIQNEKVLLVKPLTYMNASGNAIQQLINFYKIPLSNVLVIHDDMDLPVGTFKMKQGGGAGGHNGLKSLDACCGKNYFRLRIGIDHPLDKNDVINYVLHTFSKEDSVKIDTLLETLIEALPLFLEKGKDAFLNNLKKE